MKASSRPFRIYSQSVLVLVSPGMAGFRTRGVLLDDRDRQRDTEDDILRIEADQILELI